MRAGIVKLVWQLATVWGSNSGMDEIFHTHPASYTMGTESFAGVQRPGRGINQPLPSSAEVKEGEDP
jgi:hypothetical protein